MLNHINAWRPDTCGCELHYQFDDTLPAEQRVHVPIHEYTDVSGNPRKTQICADHSGLAHHEIHNHVLMENQGKNSLHGHIRENHPHLEKHFVWKFSGQGKNRVIEVSFPGATLSAEEISSIEQHGKKLGKTIKLA